MVPVLLTGCRVWPRETAIITTALLTTLKTEAISENRNVQLAYSFNQNQLSSLRLKSLRVFANVQNLKTFKNNLGYTTDYGGDATYFGYDYGGGAIPMVTTFGLNVTF